MTDVMQRLWAESPLCVTREQFDKLYEGWSIEPVFDDGRLIGAFIVRGPELHFQKLDASSVTKRHLQRVRELIAQYGYAVTKTPRADQRQLRFNQRVGFFQTAEDAEYIHLRIERIRGEKTCQPSPL